MRLIIHPPSGAIVAWRLVICSGIIFCLYATRADAESNTDLFGGIHVSEIVKTSRRASSSLPLEGSSYDDVYHYLQSELFCLEIDGVMRAYTPDGALLWNYTFDTAGGDFIGATGAVAGDLNDDGVVEIIFAPIPYPRTYPI